MSEADARGLNSLIFEFTCTSFTTRLLVDEMNGELLSSLGWWYEDEFLHHISSLGWWHEDEFLLHLVGGMNGKLPNDIRVRVVHFITWLVA
ncbi:hypothetical protein ACFX2G_010724 [Malus domestica]